MMKDNTKNKPKISETGKKMLYALATIGTLYTALVFNPVLNDGKPAKPTTMNHTVPITTGRLGFDYNKLLFRSNSPTQEQIDKYMPILMDEMNSLPEGLLEQCISGIRITGAGLYRGFSPRRALYGNQQNEIILSLPKQDNSEEERSLIESFWHELHHGCDNNLSSQEEHQAYDSLRERRPRGDITGYAREYGKINRSEDESTLIELLAVNYPEYIRRIADDPILREKGKIIEEKYYNWTGGEMDRNYWNSIAIDRFSQLK